MNRRPVLRMGPVPLAAWAIACAPAVRHGARPGASTTSVAEPAEHVSLARRGDAAAPRQAEDWEHEWGELVAAATGEGRLSLLTGVARGHHAAIDRFEQAFPGIVVEQVAEGSADTWLGRARQGRQAGTAAFDVALSVDPARAMTDGAAERLWAPLKPLLFRPDVVDDAAWRGSFDGRLLDGGGTVCFGWSYQVWHVYAVNTDLVPETAIRSVQDLLDPRWRGKIVSPDPRLGMGLLVAASVSKNRGADVLRRLVVDQRPVIVGGGPESVTEPLARGRYPIALGVRPKALDPLRAQGIGLQVRYLDLPDADFAVSSTLLTFDGAAHPAAARLFVNWVLGQEAQTVLAGSLPTNSARNDVTPGSPDEAAGAGSPGAAYYEPDREANFAHAAETQRLVRTLLARAP